MGQNYQIDKTKSLKYNNGVLFEKIPRYFAIYWNSYINIDKEAIAFAKLSPRPS